MQCQIGFHIQCQIAFRPPVKRVTGIWFSRHQFFLIWHWVWKRIWHKLWHWMWNQKPIFFWFDTECESGFDIVKLISHRLISHQCQIRMAIVLLQSNPMSNHVKSNVKSKSDFTWEIKISEIDFTWEIKQMIWHTQRLFCQLN